MILDQFKRPLKDLRISLIDRCNFRCPYCMPTDVFSDHYHFLDKKDWLSFDEIERLAKVFVSLGVKKLRLTGGEPLLRPGITKLIERLNVIPGVEDLALTTNGSFLKQYAKALKDAGLRRLTISLDTLDPVIFKALSGGRAEVTQILEGIKIAEQAGFLRLKINVVLIRGVNDKGILGLVRFFRNTGHVLRFVEYMDVGNANHWQIKDVITTREAIDIITPVFPLKHVKGTEDGDTSERYVLNDGSLEIDFISSISHAFCGTCNRLRLSADGKMYTCLFASQGYDLRSLLREGASDLIIADAIKTTWKMRVDQYSQLRFQQSNLQKSPKVEMHHIGG